MELRYVERARQNQPTPVGELLISQGEAYRHGCNVTQAAQQRKPWLLEGGSGCSRKFPYCSQEDAMDMAGLVGAAGMAIGLLLGWALWGRNQRVAGDLQARFERMAGELAGAVREVEILRGHEGELVRLRAVQAELEAERARADEREKLWAERDAELKAQFQSLAQQVLQQSQQAFLERAEEKLKAQSQTQTQDFKTLLQPVEATLKRYEEGLSAVEKARTESYSALTSQIQMLQQGTQSVREETARLSQVLRSSPKARGRWGEQQLRNVLEMAGLSEYADFRTEVSVEGETGRLRPDAVIRVPGGRDLIIDAKCSLNNFEDAFNAADEAERQRYLKAHAADVRAHIEILGRKNYWEQFENAPDYVVMFIPGEHFLAAALEQDRNLYDIAFEKRVILASPTNLIAIARTVAAIWRQEKMQEEARRIGALGKELYARLSTMGGHVVKLGKNLETAVGAYNSFVGSLETQVLSSARKFESLNVDTGNKKIETLPLVENQPRPLVKLIGNDS